MNINNTIYSLLVSLLLLCTASCSSSNNILVQDPFAKRLRRKVSELDNTASGALEYMKTVREKYSDSEGRPLFEHEDDPTSIWCMMDRDMLNKAYRPKPSSPAKCTVQNRYIFSWDVLTTEESELKLPVQKAVLRAYLKPIRRLLKASPTTVDISIDVQLLGEKEKYEAGSMKTDVTMSSSWLELEVTKGVSQLWPPTSDNHDLEFTINLSVDCKDTKKVPAIFIDPTEIQLSNAKRRQRYESFQPLFLVFFNDVEVKDIVHNETASIENFESELMQSKSENVENRERRSSTSISSCQPEDYLVIFEELYLNYVIVPFMYNARQCHGSCNHYTLTGNHQLGTNHANIMAGAYELYQDREERKITFLQPPTEPCCVPTRYSSRTLVVNIQNVLSSKVYPAMAVEECGCR